MVVKPESKKKSENTRSSVDAGNKDQLIIELKNRIAVLENEHLSDQDSATFREITERKRAEDTLRESEERFNQVLDNLTDGFTIFDSKWRFVFVNKTFQDRIGMSKEDLLGKVLWDVFPKLVGTVVYKQCQKTMEDKSPRTWEDYSNLLDNWQEYKAIPWEDGIATFAHDITERKCMEEELCRSRDVLEGRVKERTAELLMAKEELELRVAERTGELRAAHQSLVEKSRYLDAFFNHTITPLVLLDRDFNFIRVNEAYARACQKEMEEFPGHNHFEFYPSDALAIFEDVMRTRQPFQIAARPFVFPDHPEWGVTYWNWTLTPLLDDHGDVEALVFALEDVTEFKQAEIELEKHRDRLQELVRERTCDLMSANDQLRNMITEHKRAEEILRASEEKYRSLFENMLNGFAHCKMIYDDSDHPEDFIYLTINNAFSRLTGLENVVGKRATEVIPGIKDFHPDLFEIYGRVAMTGKPEQFEIEFKPLAVWLSVSVYSTGQGYFTAIFNNITDRKRAEDALRENLAMLAKSQEIGHLGSWSLDLDEEKFEISDELYRVYGFEPGTVEPTLDLVWKLIHPDDLARYREYIEALRQEGRPGGIDYRIVWPDGSVHYVHALIDSVVRGPDGRVKTASGITQEITERAQIEESLKSSETKFRTLFENARISIFVADAETGIIVDCNRYAESLVGRPRSEIVGMHQTVLHPTDKRDKYQRIFYQHIRRNLTQYEAEVQNKDGRRIPVIINAAPVVIGGKDMLMGLFLDITESKRAEEALRNSESALARSQEITGLSNWAVNFETGELEVSDQAFRNYGYEVGEVKPTLSILLSHIHPDDKEKVEKYLEMARRGEQGCVDYHIVRRDGSIRIINSVTDGFIHDKNGKIVGAYGIGQDITECAHAEKEIREAKAQAELYLDLMGHDINNMHQIALGYLELARDIHPGAGESEFLDKPIEVLQRSAQLIRNVRKLQRLKEGVFQTQLVDVCQLLAGVQREFGAVPHKAVTLNLNGCEQCYVHANELLHDVFSNLAGNAIKHTGDRADIIVDLDVVWNEGRKCCRVMVEDDGPGVPDDFKDKIFNRMLKGTDKAKGMGLGLYLVKSLVESYNGRVWAEDRVPGDHTKGARFVVMLPAIEQ
jgi:PAS domain S-box-containing protein